MDLWEWIQIKFFDHALKILYMIDRLNMSNLVRYLPSVCSLAASSSSSISSSVLRWIAVTWPAFHLGTIFAEGSSSSPLSSFSFNKKIQFLFLINFTGKIKNVYRISVYQKQTFLMMLQWVSFLYEWNCT